MERDQKLRLECGNVPRTTKSANADAGAVDAQSFPKALVDALRAPLAVHSSNSPAGVVYRPSISLPFARHKQIRSTPAVAGNKWHYYRVLHRQAYPILLLRLVPTPRLRNHSARRR